MAVQEGPSLRAAMSGETIGGGSGMCGESTESRLGRLGGAVVTLHNDCRSYGFALSQYGDGQRIAHAIERLDMRSMACVLVLTVRRPL